MTEHTGSLIILQKDSTIRAVELLDVGGEFICNSVQCIGSGNSLYSRSHIVPRSLKIFTYRPLGSSLSLASLASSCIREMYDQAKTLSTQIHQK